MQEREFQCQILLYLGRVGHNNDTKQTSVDTFFLQACPTKQQTTAMYYATAPDLFAFLRIQKEKAKLLMAQC